MMRQLNLKSGGESDQSTNMWTQKVFGFLVAFSVMAVTGPVGARHIDCPDDNSGPNLTEWREKATKEFTNRKYNDVQESFAECFPDRIPKCLRDLEEANEEKITGQPRLGTPTPLTIDSETDLPPEFLVESNGAVIPGKVKIPDNIFALAAIKGWKVSDYKTRGTGGFDTPPNLLIVAIPNFPSRGKDIFLQISPTPDSDHPQSGGNPKPVPRKTSGQGTLTVITSDKTVVPAIGQLRLMNGNQSIYDWNNELRSDSCIRCHTVPLRSISPRGYKTVSLVVNGRRNWEQPMSAEDESAVSEINQMMHVENFSWGRGSRGEKLGPKADSHPYGWAPPESDTREEDFVKQCFQRRTSRSFSGFGNFNVTMEKNSDARLTDWTKLRNAMDCYSCHREGNKRGPLHSEFTFSEIIFKVAVDRSMPPEANLTDDERLALLYCLEKEREETDSDWKKMGLWVKKNSCGF